MSVKLNYGSEIIEQLPMSDETTHPDDYAKIMPFLEEGGKVLYPMKRYIFMFALYVMFSSNLIDKVLLNVYPNLGVYPLLVTLAKALAFIIVIYIVDNFIKMK